MQAFDRGIAAGRDLTYVSHPDPSDLSGAPLWVKLLLASGSILAVSGFLIFGYTLFTGIPDIFTGIPDIGDPDFGETRRASRWLPASSSSASSSSASPRSAAPSAGAAEPTPLSRRS